MIRKVCDLYRAHEGKGLTVKDIYKKIVYPVYPISMATFYNYLGTPVSIKERELQETGSTQLGLF